MPYGYSDAEWLGDYFTTDLEGRSLHVGLVRGAAPGETLEVNLTMQPYSGTGSYEIPNYGSNVGQAPVAVTEAKIAEEIKALGGGGMSEANIKELMGTGEAGTYRPPLPLDTPGATPPGTPLPLDTPRPGVVQPALQGGSALAGFVVAFAGLSLLLNKPKRLRKAYRKVYRKVFRAKAQRRLKK